MKQYHVEESEETITIEIGKWTAIVLDELLWQWEQSDKEWDDTLRLKHDSEYYALLFIHGSLETQLAPFKSDYPDPLEAARRKLVAWGGEIERDN